MSEPEGRDLPRIRRGQPIRASFLNQIAEAAEGGTVAGPNATSKRVHGRTLINPKRRDKILVTTPTNGIPAASVAGSSLTPGQAECTLWMPTNTGWSTATNSVVTVYNVMTNAVSGSTRVQAAPLDGRYVVDVEPC